MTDQADSIRARTYGWEDIAYEDRAAFGKFMVGRGHPMAGNEERVYAADVREFCARIGVPCPQLGGNPGDYVIFVHEAEWDRAIAAALAAGHHDVPDSECVYEILVGPDRIEARRVQD